MSWVCNMHNAKTAWHLSPVQHTEAAGIMKHITGVKKTQGAKRIQTALKPGYRLLQELDDN